MHTNLLFLGTLAAAQPQEMKFSLIGLAAKGGWLMLVLLLLSLAAIYLFGNKWWMIRKAGKMDPHFMRDIRALLREGKIRSAADLCASEETPVARMVEAGLEKIGREHADIQAAMENAGNLEVAKIEKWLPMLATIAGGAPMIGFLGTVMGMVQAFFNMSQAGGNVDITLLSGGIYTAMVTTVGGLFVGIIAYFGYNYLTSEISNLVFRMDSATSEFMDIVCESENLE